jgi:phosphatidate cytidylyltransferase
MKQRILSGIVMAVIVAAVLLLSIPFPTIITLFLGVICGVAVYEMLYNTKLVENKTVVAVSVIFAGLMKLAYTFEDFLEEYLNGQRITEILTVCFALFLIIYAVARHNSFTAKQMCFSFAMPVMLSFAFNSIEYIYLESGLSFYGLLMLVNFACINDIGAYFIGSKFGRHKMTPVISPKKTVEGAIGGLASSLVATVIIVALFNGFKLDIVMIKWLIVTPIFCIIGIYGDLIASVIKRYAGIKDYGNVIPGHGGIMDRLDSILLIAPVMELLLKLLLK